MNDTNAKTNEKKNQSSFHNIGWKFFFSLQSNKIYQRQHTTYTHTHTQTLIILGLFF